MDTSTKFLEQQHIQGIDHEDKPVKDEVPYVEGGLGKKKEPTLDETNKRYENTHVGDIVYYPRGKGKVIKKTGEYITILNEDKLDQAHINETYHEGDMISQLWTQMFMESRQNLLRKANIPIFLAGRGWFDLPKEAKDILKSGFAGREEGVTRRQESESYRDAINNPHVQKPVDEEADEKEGKKEKSDIEYGAYGGVTTRTFFDATEDYEEDGVRTKKPLSGPTGNAKLLDNADGSKFKGAPKPVINEVELEEKDDGGAGNDPGGLLTTSTAGVDNAINSKRENKKKGAPEQNPNTYGMKYGITAKDLEEFREKGTLKKKIFS